MAKAHKAPMDRYTRQHVISPHAIERMRERFNSWLQKEGILSDQAVGNLLDQLVCEAEPEQKTELIDNSSGDPLPTTLVELNDPARFGPGLSAVALVRPDKEGRGRVVVTVLTQEMVAANKRSGAYVKPDFTRLTDGHRPFSVLKDMKIENQETNVNRKTEAVVTAIPVPAPVTAPVKRSDNDILKEAVEVLKRRAADAFMNENDERAAVLRAMAKGLVNEAAS